MINKSKIPQEQDSTKP